MTSSFKIFQIEKNNEEIRNTVLTNIVKMLSERKILGNDPQSLQENIKKIISTNTDDFTYTIKLDNSDVIAIKLIPQKITAISKQSNISDFLNKFVDSHKIVVVKSISTKANQYILSNYPKTELFQEKDLMINLVDHFFVPRYELIDPESEEFKKFCQVFQCKKRNIPKLPINDPVARYYNLKKGDIVRIIRPSETTGYSSSYRLVI